MKRNYTTVLRMSAILVFVALLLSGCSNTPVKSASFDVSSKGTISALSDKVSPVLTDTQRNSIAMLNHLASLIQEINASKNSRLYLENVYASLINNTYPNAVDGMTLSQLENILDTLEEYRMIGVKRGRLQYIYEQNRARALKAAMPNPLGLLSAIESRDMKKIASSILYMAVDSYTSYTAYMEESELQHLKDGWSLDDQEAKELHNIRKDTFSYMIRMVNDYNLPGEFALSEKAINDFVSWKNNNNILRRIQFLEANREIYATFGDYWLTLADSYFNNGEYQKCLDAVDAYESLDIHIFRHDGALARVLPSAILSSREVHSNKQYILMAESFLEKLLSNSDNSNWALRYFAAQTYLDLYSRAKNKKYLHNAYDIALNNVNYLLNEQKTLNTTYMADIQKVIEKKGASKKEKAEISKHNKMLEEKRKNELPPIHEPLLLNQELLFSLASMLNISESEKSKIDDMIHENNESIFLISSIDYHYRFNNNTKKTDSTEGEVIFNGKELLVPVVYLTKNAVITATIQDSKNTTVIKDWELKKVERKNKEDITKFIANYYSKTAEKQKYTPNSVIYISILPKEGNDFPPFECSFTVYATKKQWYEHLLFWNDGLEFRRTK